MTIIWEYTECHKRVVLKGRGGCCLFGEGGVRNNPGTLKNGPARACAPMPPALSTVRMPPLPLSQGELSQATCTVRSWSFVVGSEGAREPWEAGVLLVGIHVAESFQLRSCVACQRRPSRNPGTGVLVRPTCHGSFRHPCHQLLGTAVLQLG